MKEHSCPVHIIEEHNEAFFIWHKAIKSKIVPPTGNRLLHIDEHSDMSPGRFRNSIHELGDDINEIQKFTYTELVIDTFITSAIYRKIFKRIDWVKPFSNLTAQSKESSMYVRSYNNEGKKLIVGKQSNKVDHERINNSICIQYFDFSILSLSELVDYENTILDIDLDYFSCTGSPYKQNEFLIEITEHEYLRFLKSPYHRLNFLFSKVEVAEEDGRYYYVINRYNEVYLEKTYVNEEEIIKRIDQFVTSLMQIKIKPLLIVICRSRFSGFTPGNQWEFIEANLLKKLSSIYRVELVEAERFKIN